MAQVQKGTVLKTVWLVVFIFGAIIYFTAMGLVERVVEKFCPFCRRIKSHPTQSSPK